MKRAFLLPALAPLLLLTGCQTTSVTDNTDLDGPAYGKRDETSFVAGTDGSPVGIGDLAKIAKTIRKYKNLGASEQEIIRQVASLKLDGLIAGQMQRLAPKFEAKKAVVRQKTAAKIAVAKQTATRKHASPGKPVEVVEREVAATVEKEVATVQAEEKKEIAQIDLEWKSAARTEVAKSYGSDFAVPVQNAEGKAVVAFASLKDSGVSVSSASYELAGSSGQLSAAASAGQKVSHEGKNYALLDATAGL